MGAGRALGVLAVLGLVALAPPAAHADEWREAQWYLDAFDVEALHEISTGEGATIGLIDTGTDVTHADLVGADIAAGTGYGSVEDPFQDPKNHGTSMAALMVGQGHGAGGADGVLGLAPDARLVVSSLNWEPEDAGEVERWQAAAIEEMIDLGADVIVTSVGGGSGAQEEMLGAIEAANDAGVPIVAAAGNNETVVYPGCADGEDCWDDAPTEDTTVTYDGLQSPADYPGVIAVFGHAADGSRWENSPDTARLDHALSAPAHDLVAADAGGGYSIQSGTSGAAPLVAATFALLRSAHPEASGRQLVRLVFNTLTDAGAGGYDAEFGWGQLDPLAALKEPLPGPASVTEGSTVTGGATGGATEGATEGATGAEPGDEYTYPEEPPLWLQHTISLLVLVLVIGGVTTLAVWFRRRRRRRLHATAAEVGAPASAGSDQSA